MFNVNSFKTNLAQNGFLQTNRFKVLIPVPNILQGTFNVNQNNAKSMSQMSNLLTFRAEGVKAPGIALNTNDYYRYGIGTKQQMPYTASYTDNTITFISDNNGDIWTFWYSWIKSIFGFAGNDNAANAGNAFNTLPSYQLEYKDQYTTEISIIVYDLEGNEVQKLNLYEAYPISINDAQLNWGDTNNLLRITVGISFKEFTIEGAGLNNQYNGSAQAPANPFALRPAATLNNSQFPINQQPSMMNNFGVSVLNSQK